MVVHLSCIMGQPCTKVSTCTATLGGLVGAGHMLVVGSPSSINVCVVLESHAVCITCKLTVHLTMQPPLYKGQLQTAGQGDVFDRRHCICTLCGLQMRSNACHVRQLTSSCPSKVLMVYVSTAAFCSDASLDTWICKHRWRNTRLTQTC